MYFKNFIIETSIIIKNFITKKHSGRLIVAKLFIFIEIILTIYLTRLISVYFLNHFYFVVLLNPWRYPSVLEASIVPYPVGLGLALAPLALGCSCTMCDS